MASPFTSHCVFPILILIAGAPSSEQHSKSLWFLRETFTTVRQRTCRVKHQPGSFQTPDGSFCRNLALPQKGVCPYCCLRPGQHSNREGCLPRLGKFDDICIPYFQSLVLSLHYPLSSIKESQWYLLLHWCYHLAVVFPSKV